MKCWNCRGVLPADGGDLCPHCRAARPPAQGSRAELVGAAVAAAGGGVGYYLGGDWTGAAFGLSAGVPLGCVVAFLWSRPPTVG